MTIKDQYGAHARPSSAVNSFVMNVSIIQIISSDFHLNESGNQEKTKNWQTPCPDNFSLFWWLKNYGRPGRTLTKPDQDRILPEGRVYLSPVLQIVL